MIGNNTSRVVHVMIVFNKVYYNRCRILFKFLSVDVEILTLLPIIFNGSYYDYLWRITWLFICDNSTWLTEHRRRPNLLATAFTNSIGPVIVSLMGVCAHLDLLTSTGKSRYGEFCSAMEGNMMGSRSQFKAIQELHLAYNTLRKFALMLHHDYQVLFSNKSVKLLF